ncbi:MAG: hypothetical protein IJL63_05655 [Clostridia bacterium]|nr:hypothetical protein [Clostridia bacterium]
MACFVVPAVEAIVVTGAYLAVKHSENKKSLSLEKGENNAFSDNGNVSWSKRLSWLLGLLWGGVLLLAFEHFWHGEVVPFPPFLTAMADPEDAAEMFHEMMTVGVSMAATVTLVWAGICAVVSAKVKSFNRASAAREK